MLRAVFLALLLPSTSTGEASSREQRTLLHNPGASSATTEYQKRIAIIGGGIGGASAAFNIHKQNRNLPPQQVTIFEKEFSVGGRIQSIYLYPNTGGLKVVEDGAMHFSSDDWCLMSAMQDVGLKPRAPPSWPASHHSSQWMSIYRLNPRRIGQQIRSIRDLVKQQFDRLLHQRTDDETRTDLKCNVGSTGWQDRLRGRWKYGRSWQVFHSAVHSTLENWSQFGGPYHSPFSSIMKELRDVGLTEDVASSATTYLQNLTLSAALQLQMIQPCTRGQTSQDLSGVSGLSALIATARSATMSVDGGNSRLVERMIRLSEADIQLGSLVTAITPGFSRRYRLSISKSEPSGSAKDDDLEFDVVVLAAPLRKNEFDISNLDLRQEVAPDEYLETHVTHFSSSIPVSSNISVLPLDINIVDENILTTSTTDHPKVLNIQRSDACFRSGCLPGDDCDQCDDDIFLYRVHSHQYMEDEDLLRMIGYDSKEDKELSDYGIHFVRRRAWPHSFPRRSEETMNIVDGIEIARDLFYLNGAESLLSSMEMSCRMGRNVAGKALRSGRRSFL